MNSAPQQWTVLSLLEWTSAHLTSKGFDETRLHVELLLAHVLHLRRLDLYLQFDRPLKAEELSEFRALYERRLNHEPLQYILGETEFMGMRLLVSPSVLIPRPETEILVEQVLAILGDGRTRTILDVGCGAGTIGIPIAARFPAIRVVSFDCDSAALEVARRNAELHRVTNMEFVRGSILEDGVDGAPFDMVLSNPPYVPREEWTSLQEEVRSFEPRTALTDEGDGLSFYRRIGTLLPVLLSKNGTIAVEVGHDQAGEVSRIFDESGVVNIRKIKDYAGIDRVVLGNYAGDSARGDRIAP